MFGYKKPTERKAKLFLRFGCFTRSGESRVGSEFCFREHRETSARQVQNPTTNSQEWQEDDNPHLGNGEQVRSGVCERSGSCGRLVRGVEHQLERTSLDFQNMQISDNRYVDKVFENLRQKMDSFGGCSFTQ